MDRSQALVSLPALHAVAVRLDDAGVDTHTIGVALGIDDDQVPPLLTVAKEKLTRLIDER